MRYFSYMAEQAFKTTPDGNRWFYRSGPWSRPYLVPDSTVESRLFTKQLWLMRILMGGFLISLPIFFTLVPDFLDKPIWFFGLIAIETLVFRIVGDLVLRHELVKLPRAASRVPLRDFYRGMAAQHTTGQLVALLVLASVFVATGVWMLITGDDLLVAGFVIGIFSLSGIAAAYGITTKLAMRQKLDAKG
jgi:hypothetical protein